MDPDHLPVRKIIHSGNIKTPNSIPNKLSFVNHHLNNLDKSNNLISLKNSSTSINKRLHPKCPKPDSIIINNSNINNLIDNSFFNMTDPTWSTVGRVQRNEGSSFKHLLIQAMSASPFWYYGLRERKINNEYKNKRILHRISEAV